MRYFIAEMEEKQLLLQSISHICSVALPLSISARRSDQQLSRKTLHDGIMRRHFAGGQICMVVTWHLLLVTALRTYS